MSESTVVAIALSIFGALLAIIGFFVARALAKIDTNIEKIFTMYGAQEKEVAEFKLEVAKNYITKEDCSKQEQQREEFLKRIEDYRARHASVVKTG